MSKPVGLTIRRILFPTDFSPTSETAFDYAQRMAVSTGASLTVLHVFALPDFWGTGGKPEEVDEKIKRKLQEFTPRLDGVSVEYLSHGGPAGEVICWIAQEHHCDLIVMGTHGHTGLVHLLMGSVAEHVVRRAPCPVFTVRSHAEKETPIKEPIAYAPMPPII